MVGFTLVLVLRGAFSSERRAKKSSIPHISLQKKSPWFMHRVSEWDTSIWTGPFFFFFHIACWSIIEARKKSPRKMHERGRGQFGRANWAKFRWWAKTRKMQASSLREREEKRKLSAWALPWEKCALSNCHIPFSPLVCALLCETIEILFYACTRGVYADVTAKTQKKESSLTNLNEREASLFRTVRYAKSVTVMAIGLSLRPARYRSSHPGREKWVRFHILGCFSLSLRVMFFVVMRANFWSSFSRAYLHKRGRCHVKIARCTKVPTEKKEMFRAKTLEKMLV